MEAWRRGDLWIDGDKQHLVLKGPAGVGKSWLAVRLALRSLPDRRAVRFDVSVFDAVDHAGLMEDWATADILIMDDLGAEWDKPGGTYAANRLDALVRTADANLCRVIATTNLGRDGLEERYPDPMVDRLFGDGQLITMKGPNRRGRATP